MATHTLGYICIYPDIIRKLLLGDLDLCSAGPLQISSEIASSADKCFVPLNLPALNGRGVGSHAPQRPNKKYEQSKEDKTVHNHENEQMSKLGYTRAQVLGVSSVRWKMAAVGMACITYTGVMPFAPEDVDSQHEKVFEIRHGGDSVVQEANKMGQGCVRDAVDYGSVQHWTNGLQQRLDYLPVQGLCEMF